MYVFVQSAQLPFYKKLGVDGAQYQTVRRRKEAELAADSVCLCVGRHTVLLALGTLNIQIAIAMREHVEGRNIHTLYVRETTPSIVSRQSVMFTPKANS